MRPLSWSSLPARCLTMVAVVLVIGLAAGRADVVALAAPFLLGPLLVYRHRSAPPRVTMTLDTTETDERGVLHAQLALAAGTDLDVVSVSLSVDGFEAVDGTLTWTTTLRADQETRIVVALRARRWGHRRVGPVSVVARSSGLFAELPTVSVPAVAVRVFPNAEMFRSSSAAPYAVAFAGAHRSRSVGPGVELAGVRPIQPGDRLRRINWKATLRNRSLHVTTAFTDQAASVLVLVDSAHDSGPPGASTLDTSVRVALAIAEHYLGLGDSVAVAEYGGRRRSLRAGLGRTQLLRIRHWLLDVKPPPPGVLGLHGAPAGRPQPGPGGHTAAGGGVRRAARCPAAPGCHARRARRAGRRRPPRRTRRHGQGRQNVVAAGTSALRGPPG